MESFWHSLNILVWSKFDFKSRISTNGDYWKFLFIENEEQLVDFCCHTLFLYLFASMLYTVEKCHSQFLHSKWLVKYFQGRYKTIFFINVVPSNEETSFQPPYIVCISVIIHYTHNSLQFSMDLCVQLSMNWFVHLFLDIWVLMYQMFFIFE